MRRHPVRHVHGLTLVELVGALAISAMLMAPLAALLRDATGSQVAGRTALDLNADLRFALERIATAAATVPTPAPPALPAGGADVPALATLLPYTYTLSNGNLVETDATAKPVRNSVIASNVTAFSLSAPDIAAGQGLVRVDLTLAANGVSVSGARVVRLWGPQ